MPDFLLSVRISRDGLGLTTLDLNDHINYYISSQSFMGGQVAWNRQQTTSPFVDGSYTLYRNKQQVTDTISIEVLGTQYLDMMTKLRILVSAFTQDTYNLQIGLGSAALQYECEAADYTFTWDSARMSSRQPLLTFSIPRHPVPVVGGV